MAGNAVDDIRAAEAMGALPEPLRQEFAELGLSPYEVRVLLALLRVGPMNTLQLARVSEVPRTSCYQVLDGLAARYLVKRLDRRGPSIWVAASRPEVFERLEEALVSSHAKRARKHREHTALARQLLAAWLPEARPVALPYVHQLPGPTEAEGAFDEMLAGATDEALMFTRQPYLVAPGQPKAPILKMLARGVKARVLYRAHEWEVPEATAWHRELVAYHAAGVEARLVEALPLKLVVVDRRVALIGITDQVAPGAGYPVTLLIEHPGYAAVQAQAFEQLWESSSPLTPVPPIAGGTVPNAPSDSPSASA